MSKTVTKPLLTIRKKYDQQVTHKLFNDLQNYALGIIFRNTEHKIGEIENKDNGEFTQLIKWGEKNSEKLDKTIEVTVYRENESTGHRGSLNRYELTFNCSHDGLPVVNLCQFLQRELREPTTIIKVSNESIIVDYQKWQEHQNRGANLVKV